MNYTTGTRVQVETYVKATHAMGFVPGTVESVKPLDSGHFDVLVRTDEDALKMVRVGKRGGGRQIRRA